MVTKFTYIATTKSFGWGGTLMTAATLAGTAAQMATLPKQLSDKEKYGVAALGTNGRPISKTVKALSAVDAIQKVKKSTQGTRYKAFKIPEQDDQFQAYMESLGE